MKRQSVQCNKFLSSSVMATAPKILCAGTGSRLLLTTALCTILALHGVSPDAAQAQNCVVTPDGSCVISGDGIDGTDGPDAIGDEPGTGGSTGSQGGNITALEIDNLRALVSSGVATSPMNITAIGGLGGNGGNADGFDPLDQNAGGPGAPGQDGGAINVIIGANTNGYAFSGSTGLAISGVTIASAGGRGGGGGVASWALGSQGNGLSAKGGDGQSVVASIGGDWGSAAGDGVYVASLGGDGGTGRSHATGLTDGANGGLGGNSSFVTATISGQITGQTTGVLVVSAGGNGGNGGNGGSSDGNAAGNGGNGGNAGAVSATLASGAKVTMQESSGPAFMVGSYGGAGGAGGSASAAGLAGAGGNAGDASASINGIIVSYNKNDSYGVLVQSIGGIGGNGGRSAAWFNPQGGNGNLGGTSGKATITGTDANIQTGIVVDYGDPNAQNETAVIAQSIGGGGGVGGNAKDGWFAVGGAAGDGSAGNIASASLTDSIVITNSFLSSGIVAQSIGGGGGKGGDVTSSTGVLVNLVVGGTAGAGGSASDAYAANLGNGTVTTFGDHSPGVVMQSIGGGGGSGGGGYGSVTSESFGVSIAIGGSGGSGGNGGTVNAAQADTNTGAISTAGAESYGILAQSIGGGGGSGGASLAKSSVYGAKEYPAVALSVAIGGGASDGGAAEAVFLQNRGFVATLGNGAAGLVGQAIGGGGGTGGDADASAKASGGGLNLAADVTHGGKGGGGGAGAIVNGQNSGFILTRGESADGMLVQSIGGGGGAGGAGDALASTEEQKSLSTNLALGGQGGNGGQGYDVFATNSGAILTLGDGAHGILAQTIGGGGGRAGGAAASTSSTVGLNVAVGGSGGNGGDTFYKGSSSGVTNTGAILTYGADAGGILAQSIGGGGGAGGKAGTTLGSDTSQDDGSNGDAHSTAGDVNAIINKALEVHEDYETAMAEYNNLKTLASTAATLLNIEVAGSDIFTYLDDTAALGGKIDLSNFSSSNTLILAVGGKGGAGGAGGEMSVTNNGSVATMGNLSDAIVAQSVGGGGGKGGAAATSAPVDWSSPGITSGVRIGGGTQGSGSNPNATSGAFVNITHTGSAYTTGAISAGIIAQSIGMGGGIGGTTTVTAPGTGGIETLGFSVSLGGTSTAKNGISQLAQVTSSGAIQTAGHDSYGIIAQSISGGGGIIKTLAANLDSASGSDNTADSKDFQGNISLGSTSGVISGISGAAQVTTSAGGTITTNGDNGIGILAQSVAGGGGLALGGKPVGATALELLGSGGKTGTVNPGLDPQNSNSGVIVEVGDNITTSGRGGVGVFAQSVGGGGGIAGDIGWGAAMVDFAPNHSSFVGNGGDVKVTVDTGAAITTSGWSAAGIIAQSVGGGGGWVATRVGTFVGSAGGGGLGYPVNVSVQGAVDAQGAFSPGIFAQSTGGADNGGIGSNEQIKVTVGSSTNSAASVWGGSSGFDAAAAIYFANGGDAFSNQLLNYGTIATHDTKTGTAVFANGAAFVGTNWGNITGNIHIAHGNITNEGSGTINPYASISLGGGTLVNKGKMDLSGETDVTTLEGSYSGAGKLVFDADFTGGTSDRLVVTGDALVGDTLTVNAKSIHNRSLKLLSASGKLTLDPAMTTADSSHLYDFKATASGNELSVTPVANFASKASGFGANERAVAANLQSLFDGGASADLAFTRLLGVTDDAGYAAGLRSLAGQGLGAFGAFRFNSSRTFAANLYGGCQEVQLESRTADRCGWSRVLVNDTTQDESADTLGYSADAFALQTGGQLPLSDNLALTGSIAYESTKFRDESRTARISGDSLVGGLGLLYTPARLELSAGIDAAYGWYKSSRTITVGLSEQASAKPEQSQIGGHVRAAYNLLDGGTTFFRPFVEGHAIHVSNKAFTEGGTSPFRLAVEAQSDTALIGVAGVELGTKLPLSAKVTLRPFASAAIEYGSAREWTTTARFADQPQGDSFDLTTAGPGTLGRFSIGADILGAKNIAVSVQYAPEFGSGFRSQSGTAKLTIAF
ncbi:autotransporter outer membrane beta-barrel domain-containing protein [Sandaracinobacteroides hominis]|uniref:autotransporter outer membrane beta-barrel domain-containing protein n=1 Tax=Sandaracinobacteroides hominis TaxID=2780086 RepID=UPI0018F632A0|nr:autotransporter outer membrane beta-barrel domain-containing protein [Sandaracinobacteroides hominis]